MYISSYNDKVNVSIITVKQLLGHLAHAHPEKFFVHNVSIFTKYRNYPHTMLLPSNSRLRNF